MWVASKHGFFSIVAIEENYRLPGGRLLDRGWLIRARKKRDLEALKAETYGHTGQIWETPDQEYPFRIAVTEQAVFTQYISVLMRSVTYGNFQLEIEKNKAQRDKVPYYREIAKVMRDYQEGKPITGPVVNMLKEEPAAVDKPTLRSDPLPPPVVQESPHIGFWPKPYPCVRGGKIVQAGDMP